MAKTTNMEFVKTPATTGSVKEMIIAGDQNFLSKISTGRIVAHLLQRHKFGLVTAWAVLITITYVFPPIWDILKSVIS